MSTFYTKFAIPAEASDPLLHSNAHNQKCVCHPEERAFRAAKDLNRFTNHQTPILRDLGALPSATSALNLFSPLPGHRSLVTGR
jgi:hypothetical protein